MYVLGIARALPRQVQGVGGTASEPVPKAKDTCPHLEAQQRPC